MTLSPGELVRAALLALGLAALAKHQLRAALFVTAGNGADRPEGLALAKAWSRAGH